MADQVSISEFICQAQRGLMGRVFGDEQIRKAYLNTAASTFNQTYGRKVWDALNNRRVTYNAIKKVPWGNTAGWVLRTDRGDQRIRPVTEEGTLPTIDVSAYKGVYSLPKIPTGVFGVPVRTIFVNQLEGGMGDILATEQEATERDFVKDINKQILSQSAFYVTKDSTYVVSLASGIDVEDHIRVGDTWAYYKHGTGYADTAQTVSTVTSSANSATLDTGINATGDTLYVKSRAGLTSLFDIVAEDSMLVCQDQARPDVYNLDTRTAAGAYAGAYISAASGVARELTLPLLDNCIQKIRERGGEPKLITMGWDQYFKLERLLNAQQRYMGQEEYIVGVGDERTLPGTRTGLVLSTYMGIPILGDADMAKSTSSAGVVRGSDILVLDTDYLEVAVALPTQYVENRDYFQATALVVRGLMYMMAELRATRLDVHARITDLLA
jgi:hypothetical protein